MLGFSPLLIEGRLPMSDIPASTKTKAVLEGDAALGSFSGRLEKAGDSDWIKVHLVAGTTYTFYLGFLVDGSATDGDSFLVLRRANGSIETVDDQSGVGDNSVLTFAAAKTGTYFLDVSAFGPVVGDYSLASVASLIFPATEKPLNDSDDIGYTGLSNERILCGKGNDIIDIGAGLDALGEQGNDSITGNGFGNHIWGGIGGDTIDGGDGIDTIFGDAGNDTIHGGPATDNLYGGAGADNLFGDELNDFLIGGSGKDFLTGGTNGDHFIFRKVSDSTRGASHRDVITDFSSGEADKIDVSHIDADMTRGGDQKFTFIKSHAFHHRGGELRAIHDATNDLTIVQGDVNGDGRADFEVALLGQHVLHRGDFVL
jgi:Ca2+-binding RTX toxin-like protein